MRTRKINEMIVKDKEDRQYNGEIFNTADPTPDDELLDKYNEDGQVNGEIFTHQTVEYYSMKKSAIDIAIEMLKLTNGPTTDDVIKTAAVLLDFIVDESTNA